MGGALQRWRGGELLLKSEEKQTLPLPLLALPSAILGTFTHEPLRQLEDTGALWSPVHRLRLVACGRRVGWPGWGSEDRKVFITAQSWASLPHKGAFLLLPVSQGQEPGQGEPRAS